MASSLWSGVVRTLRIFRSTFGVGVAVVALSTIRCSAAGGPGGDGDGDGDGDQNDPEGRMEWDLFLGGAMGGSGAQGVPLDPLCGSVGTCLPDDKNACEGLGGAGGQGQGGEGGGVIFDPGDLEGQGMSCQVRRCQDESCDIERACAPAGASGEGEPCVSASDCRAGMACVGEGISGVCRPYCCRGAERSCGKGTFCDERSVPESPGVFVPVCTPVDDCPLTDPVPCPEGQECSCQGDSVCVVVRADGATACTTPGPGRTGDPCNPTKTAQCAHGFVCSNSAGCMKLCDLAIAAEGPEAEEEQCPGGGSCTPPPEFPTGLGVCVGTDDGAAAAR